MSVLKISAIVNCLYVKLSMTRLIAYSNRFEVIPVLAMRSAKRLKKSADICGNATDSFRTETAICCADAGSPAKTEISLLPFLASMSASDAVCDGAGKLIRAWWLIRCTSDIVRRF